MGALNTFASAKVKVGRGGFVDPLIDSLAGKSSQRILYSLKPFCFLYSRERFLADWSDHDDLAFAD